MNRAFGTSRLTKDDQAAVMDTFKRFDEVVKILRALPTAMLLVFRWAWECAEFHYLQSGFFQEYEHGSDGQHGIGKSGEQVYDHG